MKYTFKEISKYNLAWHPEIMKDGYYEWWYFDAVYDNGYITYLSFSPRTIWPTPGMSKEEAVLPWIEIRVTTPDGTNLVAEKYFPISEFKASNETTDVTIGAKNTLKITKAKANGLPEEYHMKMSEGDLAVDLTYHVMVTGMQFTEKDHGWTYYNPKQEKCFGWWPAAPKSRVEGTITVKGKTVNVKGYGYHDHQLGNYNFVDAESRWFWGHFYAGDYTAVWVHAPAPKKHRYAHFTPFMLWKKDIPIFCTYNFTCYPEEFAIDKETGLPYPVVSTLRATEGDIHLTAQIHRGPIIRTVKIANMVGQPFTEDRPGAYWAFLSDIDIQLKRWGNYEEIKGQTLHEFGWMSDWWPQK